MLDGKSVVDTHRCHMASKFCVFVDGDHSKLPTLYWYLNFIIMRPYNSRYIATSSSSTATELFIILTS